MHPRELVETAALAAWHAPALWAGRGPLPCGRLELYWAASKCRLDRWSRALKELMDTPSPAERRRAPFVAKCRGVVEEVLSSEVLTRVWTGVLLVHDRRRNMQECTPVARSVLLGHQEARHRALRLLVRGPIVDTREAVALNRLRRRAECWNDMLIGQLCVYEDLIELAFVAQRAREFAADARGQDAMTQALTMGSLRAAFTVGFGTTCPNPDLNADIAASIVGCFESEAFDSLGLPTSAWMTRLQRTTDETQALVDELFAADSFEQPPSDTRHAAPFPRWRTRPQH